MPRSSTPNDITRPPASRTSPATYAPNTRSALNVEELTARAKDKLTLRRLLPGLRGRQKSQASVGVSMKLCVRALPGPVLEYIGRQARGLEGRQQLIEPKYSEVTWRDAALEKFNFALARLGRLKFNLQRHFQFSG